MKTLPTLPEENPLAKAVAELLAPNGAMAKALPHFVHSPEQVALARAYAAGVGAPDPQGGGKIAAIEAATGMGKTVAYLSVLALNAAMTGETALLSTRTRALQRQIAASDGPAVRQAVRIQTGTDIGDPQPRVGRGNYPDPNRLRRLADDLRRENPGDRRPAQLRAIADLVARDNDDAATFDDLQQNYGLVLPSGVAPETVRLTAAADQAAAKHYNRHRQAGQDAAIVVVNHALALMDARAAGGLFAAHPRRRVALFDEADALPEQARAMTDEQADLETLRELANAAPDEPARQLRAALAELRRRARHALKNGPAVVKPDSHLIAAADSAAAAVRALQLPALFSELRDELRAAAVVLRHWAKVARQADPHFAATVIPAPVRNRPALSLCALSPAAVLARLWRKNHDHAPLFRAAVFTSATLSPNGETGDRYNPDLFLNAVNAPRGEINHHAVAAFAPAQFGQMQFVLADRDAPAPFRDKNGKKSKADDNDDPREINPDFLQFIANGIQLARQQGGRTLVLAPSFEFAQLLGELLPPDRPDHPDHPGIRVHRRGESVAEQLNEFRADDNAVLITPSAWEGINLPGLVRRLVIPRVPFPPPNDARLAALEEKFRAHGRPAAAARHILAAEHRFAAVRKLRQGIGRGIRRPNDQCQLWLLDPRFPLPAAMLRNPRNRLHQGLAARHGNLAAAIPARFRQFRGNPLERAQLLTPDGQLRRPRP